MSISKSFTKTIFKFGLLFALIAIITFGFAGCGGLGSLKEGPDATDTVFGNGGLAVQKGEYLYFTNGYMDIADVGDTNTYGKVDYSAIYRIKLEAGKVVETNPDYYDEDNKLVTDKTLALNDLDILAPKVAGFEYSNLYIFGDYLYYTTPNNLKDKDLEVQSDYLHFYRVRLDRSGANELVYSTENINTEVKFTMYQIEDVVYQVILDGEKLVLNTIKNNRITRDTISEEVTQASLPVYQNSTDEINAIDKKIYYTQESEDFNGTKLYAYNLEDAESELIFGNENVKYEIINTNGNFLYYIKTNNNPPAYGAKIYTLNVNNQESVEPISDLTVNSSNSEGIKTYALASPHHGRAIIYSNGTNTYFKKAGDSAGIKFISSDITSKIVQIDSNFVYFLKDSNLYKIDYTKSGNTETLVIPEGTTPKGDKVTDFDVDDKNVYFFVKHDDKFYLHYISYDPSVVDDEGNPYTHFVGKLIEEDDTTEEDHDDHDHDHE